MKKAAILSMLASSLNSWATLDTLPLFASPWEQSYHILPLCLLSVLGPKFPEDRIFIVSLSMFCAALDIYVGMSPAHLIN